MKFSEWMKKNAVPILTATEIAALGGSAVLYTRAGWKTKEKIDKENIDVKNVPFFSKVKLFGKHFLFPATCTLVGVASSVTACVIDHKKTKDLKFLGAAYAGLIGAYGRYREEIRNDYGIEADEKGLVAAARGVPVHRAKEVYLSSIGAFSAYNTTIDTTEEYKTFYEPISGVCFEARWSQVMNALYHLNRKLLLGMEVPVSMYHEFLGIDDLVPRKMDDLRWSLDILEAYYDSYWLDFDIPETPTVMDGGLECYIIDPMVYPMDDEEYEAALQECGLA